MLRLAPAGPVGVPGLRIQGGDVTAPRFPWLPTRPQAGALRQREK